MKVLFFPNKEGDFTIMKVQELREKLKPAEKDTLEKMVVELYKKFPKAKKEEEIDVLIKDLLAGPGEKVSKKSEKNVDFASLKGEILEFIENAYAGNYYEPNRVVPKHIRSKWRFRVKQFVKELEKISVDDQRYKESAELLTKLYKMMCTGCGYYLFTSYDPFRSVGIGQQEFYRKVLVRNFGIGYSEKIIKEMLLLAVNTNLDSMTINIDLEADFLSLLKTSDVKYTALRLAREEIQERELQLSAMNQYDTRKYEIVKEVEEICKTILIIGIALGEPEESVTYYFKHYGCRNGREREIALYVALDIINRFSDDDGLWIRVYEKAVKSGIQPREELMMEYERRRGDSEKTPER